MGENESVVGPSSLGPGGKKKAAKVATGKSRGKQPFRKGQIVRQFTGPGYQANQRREVVEVKWVRDGTFEGWAIKLRGVAKPMAANLFIAWTSDGFDSEPIVGADDTTAHSNSAFAQQIQAQLNDVVRGMTSAAGEKKTLYVPAAYDSPPAEPERKPRRAIVRPKDQKPQ